MLLLSSCAFEIKMDPNYQLATQSVYLFIGDDKVEESLTVSILFCHSCECGNLVFIVKPNPMCFVGYSFMLPNPFR